ncbi:MAG: hypothetical protein IPM97_05210 [Bdellovibrionaceae bacterium]|nr:hypothetical protein [Pseudobdellovibrionaceae bacterium]
MKNATALLVLFFSISTFANDIGSMPIEILNCRFGDPMPENSFSVNVVEGPPNTFSLMITEEEGQRHLVEPARKLIQSRVGGSTVFYSKSYQLWINFSVRPNSDGTRHATLTKTKRKLNYNLICR